MLEKPFWRSASVWAALSLIMIAIGKLLASDDPSGAVAMLFNAVRTYADNGGWEAAAGVAVLGLRRALGNVLKQPNAQSVGPEAGRDETASQSGGSTIVK